MSAGKNVMNEGFVTEFLDDYFAEADEHLTSVRRHVLLLEEYVGQAKIDREILNKLFRNFHALKGLSGMVSALTAEQLSHQMESYLQALLDGTVLLTRDGIDTLISSTSLLEQVVLAFRTNREPPSSTATVLGKLANLCTAKEVAMDSPPETVPALSATNGFGPFNLKTEEQLSLTNALQKGAHPWLFEFVPSPERSERGVNVKSIRSCLQEIGELIHAAPGTAENGTIVFEFLMATMADETTFSSWQYDGLSWRSCEGVFAAPLPGEPRRDDPDTYTETPAPPLVAASNVVRVELSRLDELMRMLGELVISRSRLDDILKNLKPQISDTLYTPLQETNIDMERQLRALREGVMRTRMMPIGEVFGRMQFVIRDLVRESRKRVSLLMGGQETELDKMVVERMMDPLLHLVRNAISHGIEEVEERTALGKPPEGTVMLRAATAGDAIIIEIEDDGRGLDLTAIEAQARAKGLHQEGEPIDSYRVLELICTPGFSTRNEVDLVSGRGVGMAVVKNTIHELGGTLSLHNMPGHGTRFTIQLPLTLAIVDALIVTAGGQTFAIPQPSIREAIELRPEEVTVFEQNEIIAFRGNVLPLLRLSRVFNLPMDMRRLSYVLVIGNDARLSGIVIDRIIGRREIVVRPITDPLVHIAGVVGATELGDGQAVLILDVAALNRAARHDKV